MRRLKNTHKWLDNINQERKRLLKNLTRINKRLDDLQHKEDGLIKDLEIHVKPQNAVPASGVIPEIIHPQGSHGIKGSGVR